MKQLKINQDTFNDLTTIKNKIIMNHVGGLFIIKDFKCSFSRKQTFFKGTITQFNVLELTIIHNGSELNQDKAMNWIKVHKEELLDLRQRFLDFNSQLKHFNLHITNITHSQPLSITPAIIQKKKKPKNKIGIQPINPILDKPKDLQFKKS